MSKRRVDTLLVERGLVESRERARAVVLAGSVAADGRRVDKPGALLPESTRLTVASPPRFASRGGEKLESALDSFSVDVRGLVAADVGASTGGFTDCLLQRGAERVYAIDVGYGQLDYRLRTDPRVVVMERLNARYVESLPEPVDLVVADVSFISLTKVLPAVARILRRGGRALTLVKPQFEARRNEVGRGGVVRDPLTRARVIGRVVDWATRERWRVRGPIASPIRGQSGNQEFFLLLTPPPAGPDDA